MSANLEARIVPQCKALGSYCGRVAGFSEHGGTMLKLEKLAADPSARSFEIVTLDSLLEKGMVPRVDFIKIDVDGFELELLRGAEGALRAFHPTILVELHTRELGLAVWDLVTAAGYTCSDLTGRKVSRASLGTARMAFDMWCQPVTCSLSDVRTKGGTDPQKGLGRNDALHILPRF